MAKVVFDYTQGSYRKLLDADQRRMAVAATKAVTQATNNAKAAGRASIAAAGFSARWQNALKSKVFPTGRVSLNAAGVISLKIPYASIFEEGGEIAGRPLLWLPIEDNLPVRSGGLRWSPAVFARSVGSLRSGRNKHGRPLLFGRIGGKWVPVFVGIDHVEIRKRFAVTEAAEAANARLPDLYEANMKNSS